MKTIVIISIYFFSNAILAQNKKQLGKDNVRIDSLASIQIQINSEKKGVDGYRVQIHHNNSQSREESQLFRAQFSSDFPDLKTYLEFKSPYFKIQAGDFVDKLNAYKVQQEISKKYEGTYIVPAIVPFR